MYITLKNKLLLLFSLSLVVTACNDVQKNQTNNLPTLHSSANKIKLNTEQGYSINHTTGDSIDFIINSSGDTVKTGVAISIEGKKIHPDSIEKPKTIQINHKQLNTVNAHSNYKKTPDNLTVIPFDINSITPVPLKTFKKKDTTNLLVTYKGDSIYTGISIPIEGRKVKAKKGRQEKALPLYMKDAATHNIQYLDMEQGLPSSYVNAMTEDKNGNIWFCTYTGGICKYDGESFTYLTKKEGLINDRAKSVLEDSKGNIWFGTTDGAAMYNGESFTFFDSKAGFNNTSVYCMLEDIKGNIWFGTLGGGVIKYDGKTMTHITENEGMVNNHVYTMYEDSKGNLWFGTVKGVSIFNGESFIHINEDHGLIHKYVSGVLEDKKGNMWLGTDYGLCIYDGKSFTHYTEENVLTNDLIYKIISDKKDNIWIATDGGVTMYDGADFIHLTKNEGLSRNDIYDIMEDKSGKLWFGTYGGGACRYHNESFKHYTEKEGLTNNYVWSIHEDSKGNMWFGTENGLNRYDGKSFTQYTRKDGLIGNFIYAIFEDSKNNLWIGTQYGLSKYDGSSFTNYAEKEGLSHEAINGITEDKKGNLWFATDNGVTMFDGTSFTHYTEEEGLSNRYIYTILEDKKGNLWFTTNGAGVSKFDGKTIIHYTEREGLLNNIVHAIFEDENGDFWFGTENEGVTRFDGENFTHYTEREGISNNDIKTIIGGGKRTDGYINIWLSTEKGLTHLAYKDEKVFTNIFTKPDGLKGIDFVPRSGMIDSKNRLWWGSGKCLTMLDMKEYTESVSPPTIQLKQLDINEQNYDYLNLPDSLNEDIQFTNVDPFLNYPLNLKLVHDKNHLTFHFIGIDWNAPHKIRYAYRLKGLNNEWSHSTKETKADYRNIPYGKYTFQVVAIGESDMWSEPFEYSFIISPPWWHTWWARTGYGIAGVILLIGFVRVRTQKLKKRQKELETEIEKATKEIRQQKDEIEEANAELAEKNKEITDSIHYAKRIQIAVLPPRQLINAYIPDSFILYKPKGIVAGDFYWLEPRENKILLAVADCTGHGVPGAMVSVFCNNGLNKSVREHNLTEPGKILDKTREIVVSEFEKSDDEVKDGMDISFVSFEPKNPEKTHYSLSFSGANNPLWIIRKNTGEIEEIKGDKQPIGKHSQTKPFTTHHIELIKGDIIYLFSDGYADQFGGNNEKKLKSINLKKIIIENSSRSMEEQKEFLDKAFEEWKGDLEQIDDVCIIGVRL